ncbi:MAG: Do family serine endopeptidase [Deltaproteobacteria bacterium]|nr:Do family serine endopeptidase [Deltaproteobacteria bacterium]
MLRNHFNKKFCVCMFVLGITLGMSQPLVASASAAENLSAVDLSTAIAIVSKQAIPAVAHIEVTQRQEVNNPLLPFENDPFFRYFFNAPRKMPKKFKREMKGLGSGMIMDSDGHILTNNHVVAGANEIEVLLADGNRYKAKLVGADPKTDLAVIQIKADGKLPHVVFGDSDKMEVGHWVIAIGHPRGLDQTVTQGIISAKHRRGILDPTSYQDYLQTDAAINPGNSGGPLLNLEGQVIGVNAAIFSESGGFEGIGFAIPSNMAVYISKALIEHGKVERGWLGVTIQELTPDLIKAMNLNISKGALIADVIKGGPADVAGIQKGDVVTVYQGKEISNGSTLQNEVANTAIGQEARVTVYRSGKTQDLKVKVDNLEDAIKKIAISLKGRLGVTVRPVTAKEAQQYGLEEGQGVAIASLQPGGSLAKVGFEVNDIILSIDDQPVKDEQSFVSLLETLKPRQTVQIWALDHNSGQTADVQVKVR